MLSEEQKRELYVRAQDHAQGTHAELEASLERERQEEMCLTQALLNYKGHDRLVQEKILGIRRESINHLAGLTQSPYFVRCDARLVDTGKVESFYFAKYSHTPSSIYSWITPASAMRYENIGPCEYRLPDGTRQKIELLRKDQFMIVRDHVVYMTNEDAGHERTLVYQEYFSKQKRQFALTDIVAQMEKAQDAVIRADARGSLLITGPAGSGKTTLALHRLAYLAQAPDTLELFPSNRMVVFVQDASSRAYFSDLLPELGIQNVLVTTFEDWVAGLLEIALNPPSRQLMADADEYDEFQYQKNAALQSALANTRTDEHYDILEKNYSKTFNAASRKLFKLQASEGSLDRFDLTLLLKNLAKRNGAIAKKKNYDEKNADGNYVTKTRLIPLNYSCIVLDEVQNYLPEQIKLLQTCIDPETKALLYVGDLAQQTKLCTLKDWKHVDEDFSAGRHVNLEKAYRNTKQILDYIRSLGYKTTIQSLREGPSVSEFVGEKFEDRLTELSRVLKSSSNQLIGVLFKDSGALESYRAVLAKDFPDVRFMTAAEAQGVEFGVVCLVDMEPDPHRKYSDDAQLRTAQKRIERDRLYVALTRAMDQLHVISGSKLSVDWSE